MNPEDFWSGLEHDSATLAHGEMVARRVCPESVCDIRLAVRAPDRCRMLLIMLTPKYFPSNADLPTARGFEAQWLALQNDDSDRVGVAIRLTDTSFKDVFSTLVQDIAELLARLKDESVAFVTLVNRLRIWQGFMQRVAKDGLDVTDQIGLYGELRFLADRLIPMIGPDGALAAWSGPDGAPQDFQCLSSALEVKTTAVAHQLIRVSNTLQLDDSTLERLFLVHLSVDRRKGHGQTLVELVDLIRSQIAVSFAASDLFAARLLQVGYLDAHAEQYCSFGFSELDVRVYRVQAGFPRIVPSSLPGGIQDVKYAIQVSALASFEIPCTQLIELLSESFK